jgi:hypothetical protein
VARRYLTLKSHGLGCGLSTSSQRDLAADLPVEQPTASEFVVNLKTAKHSASAFQPRYATANKVFE